MILCLSNSCFHCSVSVSSAPGQPWYLRYANIKLWKIGSKYSVICICNIRSKTLENAGRTVTGLKFALSSKESFLWCGAISPRFHVSGISDLCIMVFIRWLSGLAMVGADALTARGGIRSWPLALFGLSLYNTDFISRGFVGRKPKECNDILFAGMLGTCDWFWNVVCPCTSMSLATFVKYSFNVSATWTWSLITLLFSFKVM